MADRFGPVRATLVAIGLPVSVLLFASVYGLAGIEVLRSLGIGVAPGSLSRRLVGMITFQGFAVATVAGIYFRGRSAVNARLGLRRPTRSDAVWIVGGIVAIVGLFVVANAALDWLGIEPAEHALSQVRDPTAVLVIAALGVTLVPASEELLFRSIVQGTLRDAVPAAGAIAVASLLFASVHLTALLSESSGIGEGQLATLGVVFLLSLVLGVVYERTETVIVPAVVHAAFNLLQFATLYADVAG
jgi:membrane protease YdiL (CAAX protease family)